METQRRCVRARAAVSVALDQPAVCIIHARFTCCIRRDPLHSPDSPKRRNNVRLIFPYLAVIPSSRPIVTPVSRNLRYDFAISTHRPPSDIPLDRLYEAAKRVRALHFCSRDVQEARVIYVGWMARVPLKTKISSAGAFPGRMIDPRGGDPRLHSFAIPQRNVLSALPPLPRRSNVRLTYEKSYATLSLFHSERRFSELFRLRFSPGPTNR